MRDSTTTPCLLFPELFDRPLMALFDVPNASSDGGAMLLKAANRRLGLIPRLADDPMHRLLLGRDPVTGEALASQPTLSRFENDVARGETAKAGSTVGRIGMTHEPNL